MTPQQLVTAAQNGDRDAFAELWRLYHDEVMAVIYRRTHNRHVAEDLTSETFLRAWRRLPGFTWQGKGFIGWVITIAINATNDHHRAAHQRCSFPHNDFQEPDADRRNNPENVAEHADLARALDTALGQLTDDQRQVIGLRFGAALTLAETADAMGRKLGAVKSVQWRALQALVADPDLAAVAA